MCYVFSNAEKLNQLLKEERWEELTEEFVNAKVTALDTYKGVVLTAGVLYEKICNGFCSAKEVLPNKIVTHAIDLFVEIWDIKTIKRINESHGKYGKLNEKAIEVLQRYENYRGIAIDEFNSLSKLGMFEKGIKDDSNGEYIIIKYIEGRLSFFRKDVEYVVYYGEDF